MRSAVVANPWDLLAYIGSVGGSGVWQLAAASHSLFNNIPVFLCPAGLLSYVCRREVILGEFMALSLSSL